jgi:DNA-binding beta-propeller fold protein YncE
VGVYYWINKRLPIIPALAEQLGARPRFAFSIDGIAKPAGVAVSRDTSRIFVTEAGGERLIHIFDSAGGHIKSFAQPETTPFSRSPAGVAVSGDDKVYVTDSFRREVNIYSIDGDFIGPFLPNNDPNFQWAPVAVTIDEGGYLYFTDQRNPRHQVLVFDPAGNLRLQFGYFGKGEGMFNHPADVAVDASGNIYVSDSNNTRIQVFDAQGSFLQFIVGDFSLPRGIGFDRARRLHIVDSLRHQVWVLSFGEEPDPVFGYGIMGQERGQFFFPNDVALDGQGRLYVADHFGGRVQVWSFGP